jgi:hypothetical protein
MIRLLLLLTTFFTLPAHAMPEDLEAIVANIAVSSARGLNPVVIADLDETLVDSIPRRFEAYREAIDQNCGSSRQAECAKAAGVNIEEFHSLKNRYNQNPLWETIGISAGMRAKLFTDMLKAYSNGALISFDQSVPGATELVQELRLSGAKIFFVTSRSEELQREGTLASLKNLGFINASQESSVILRPKGMSSIDFKRFSFDKIKGWAKENKARVALVMENEPENMNAMLEYFPEAAAVFVEGAMVKSEPVQGPVLRLKNFR